jgi:DNA-binding CsgD family transcriptional regulator
LVHKKQYGQPLTSREREVVDFIVKGLYTREIGSILGVSPRTIEIHRRNAMNKIGARNIADLVRMTLIGS